MQTNHLGFISNNEYLINIDYTTVSFNKSMYRVDDNNGSAQVTLFLTNPSSNIITVQVHYNASGEL